MSTRQEQVALVRTGCLNHRCSVCVLNKDLSPSLSPSLPLSLSVRVGIPQRERWFVLLI